MKALRDAHQQLDSITSSIDRAVEQGLAQRALTAEEASGARRRIQQVLDSIAEARRLLAEGHSATAGSES
jgi:hypothetical protein